MKAKLEFDLDDFSDRKAHKRCVSATDAYITLYEIDQELRSIIKYDKDISVGAKYCTPEGDEEITERESYILNDFADKLRTKIHEIIEKNGINLNDLE